MSGEMRYSGGCLCGAIRYRVDGPLRPIVACHCGQCRRQSGNFVVATAAAQECFTLDDPNDSLCWYQASGEARRGFCAKCGSQLFWERFGSDTLSITAGTLDQPTGLSLVGHIFTADKADYYEIADGLPSLEGGGSEKLLAMFGEDGR